MVSKRVQRINLALEEVNLGFERLLNVMTIIAVTGPAIAAAELADILTPFKLFGDIGKVAEAFSDVPVALISELAKKINAANLEAIKLAEERIKRKKRRLR